MTHPSPNPATHSLGVYARSFTRQLAREAAELHEATQAEVQARANMRSVAAYDRAALISTLCAQATSGLKADVTCLVIPQRPMAMPQFAGRRGESDSLVRAVVAAGQQAAESLHTWGQEVVSQVFTPPMQPLPSLRIVGAQIAHSGRVIGGLLVIFRDSGRLLEAADKALLRSLADTAGPALSSTDRLAALQANSRRLALAYDLTIERWAQTLDLQSHEREGHTQRVATLTVRLARAMGCSDEALVHMRRGALLHDIGKLGLPEQLLHTREPLSAAERTLMRRHPTYAYQWLAPISCLRPALDIPHCHHERWDGGGYPRGLRGATIPLAARIFAVVDVWEALRTGRPYRPALDYHNAIALIANQAWQQLDLQVVYAFLKLLSEDDSY